jgi:outer membrane scaffolding protein for murein synthesis (MipA/OmpV family)
MLAASLALGALFATSAAAQVRQPDNAVETANEVETPAPDWRISVGGAAILRPEWDGAKDEDWLVVPDLDLRYGDLFFASVRTGVGFNLYRENGWRVGPYAKLKFGRGEGDDAALRGLGDVDPAIELGGFADWAFGPVRASLELRRGVGGHEGVVAEAGADLRARFSETVFGSIGPRVRWTDGDYAQTYFGVTPAQAARSGLPAFAADGGVESIGLNVSLGWRPDDRVVVTAFAERGELQGDAADSPLVRLRGDKEQQRFGVAFGWRLGE